MQYTLKLHKYDIVEANVPSSGSVQDSKGTRPYVIVSNEKGTSCSSIITILPLTGVIKKMHLPTHECIEAETGTGLRKYSMLLGETMQTIDKLEVKRRLGRVTNEGCKNKINKVCYYSLFYGEDINWGEVLDEKNK